MSAIQLKRVLSIMLTTIMIISCFAMSTIPASAQDDDIIVYLRGGEKSSTYDVKASKVTSNSDDGIAKVTIKDGKMTIEGGYKGEAEVVVDDTKYIVRVYTPYHFRLIDITDEDNPVELRKYTLVAEEWSGDLVNDIYNRYDVDEWLSKSLEKEKCEIVGYDANGFVLGMKDSEGYDIASWDLYVKRAEDGGKYPLKYVSKYSNSPVGFEDVVDSKGESLEKEIGSRYLMARGQSFLNDERVWCVEPTISTGNGSGYNKEAGEENIKAALAVLFGDDKDELGRAVTQALVWESVGYPNASEQPYWISLDDNGAIKASKLSSDEESAVAKLKERVEKATKLYESGELTFTSETDGVMIEDGVLVALEGKVPDEIVLKAEDPEALSLFADGQMKLAEGVTGSIDAEAGTLTLKLDESAKKAGTLISLSMIPESFPSDTVKYVSPTGKQTMMRFGIENPKFVDVNLRLAKEKVNVVKTGDEMNIALYVTILLIAITAVVAVVILRNKHSR